ncbi:MAG: CvpA family protein [bacterium]|nr:CvpA family protein [bacterium]
MNPIDIFFLIIILISMTISLFRGMVKEIFSILSIVGGILMANLFYAKIALLLIRFIKSSPWSNIIAFIIIFLVVATLINLVGLFLQKTLKKLALSWLDRVGGVAFGFIRGVIIVVIIAIILVKFPIMGNKLIASSQIVPHLSWVVKILLAFLPDEFSSIVNELIYLS